LTIDIITHFELLKILSNGIFRALHYDQKIGRVQKWLQHDAQTTLLFFNDPAINIRYDRRAMVCDNNQNYFIDKNLEQNTVKVYNNVF